MKHKWNKLHSEESDHSIMPVIVTTLEQCEFCRCVRHTYKHGSYMDTKACLARSYAIGDGWITTQPPCVTDLPVDVQLRQKVKDLRQSLQDLEKKVHLR
jgi:hypothetical protein